MMSAIGEIVLQKSFGGDERNFVGPLMRSLRRDVRDLIAHQKNGRGAWYRRHRVLQRRSRQNFDFREIFRVVRFWAFATLSSKGRTSKFVGGRSTCDTKRTLRLTLARCALVRTIGRDRLTTPKVQPHRVRWQSGQRRRNRASGVDFGNGDFVPHIMRIEYVHIPAKWGSKSAGLRPRLARRTELRAQLWDARLSHLSRRVPIRYRLRVAVPGTEDNR